MEKTAHFMPPGQQNSMEVAMRVEKTASFAEILGSIHAPDEEYSLGIKKVETSTTQPEGDRLQLSAQGEIVLSRSGRGKGSPHRDFPPAPEFDTQIDQQGNKVRLSSQGAILAEAGADEVAWETGRSPRARSNS